MSQEPNLPLGPLVATEDGSYTIEDPLHGETYHSRFGARREARELYVEASGLPQHLDQRLSLPQEIMVLDVGLGLAYNAIETIRAWLASPQPGALRIVSLELNQTVIKSITSDDAPWTVNWDPELRRILSSFRRTQSQVWQATMLHPQSGQQLTWEIHHLDASQDPLPYHGDHGDKKWDFIWQDPFSPRINPSMWCGAWFKKLFVDSHPHTRLMTYSVARSVREALEEGGWQWTKIKTASPLKKNWLQAWPLQKSKHEAL